MTNIQKNFQKSHLLYQNKVSFLPPKIVWKLDLILYMIRGNIPNKELLTIQQQMQFEDLQNLEVQSLKIVFNQIIDTLFSKQAIDMKKCLLKKKGWLSAWTNAEIFHDAKNFLINYSHKTYTYEKIGCQIKKSKESKRSLEFYFHKSFKYTLKFQNEAQMNQVWQGWQKQIIQTKTQKNYEEMKTLTGMQNGSTYMEKINLFIQEQPKKAFSPEKTSFSPQTMPLKSKAKQSNLNKSFMVNSEFKKRTSQQQIICLKPVPYKYLQKLKNQRSVIAISQSNNAKIYVEHIFNGKYNQKRLLSLLLLQKTWNSFILSETVHKSQNQPSQILIKRKYDTLKELGQYIETYVRATYAPWNQKMSMIVIESEKLVSQERKPLFYTKSFIVLQAEGNHVRISIQEELDSENHCPEKLKKILYEMYCEISKLQLIQEKLIINDFQAETLIINMFQYYDQANTESMGDLSSIQNFQSQKNFMNYSPQYQKDQQSDLKCSIYELSKINQKNQVLRLKSPLQFPNLEYFKMIRKKQHENKYFLYYFPQDNLETFDNYIPYYRLDKMIESKTYQITQNRELKFIDQQLLDSQKQTLKFVIRQIGANLISGKSVLNVSLPVDIFQSRTGLQRSASSFACCPDYLIPIAHSSPIEQLKYVTGFILNVISCELVMQKPFNPILGETFQGYIRGIPIYYEQTSHSPPISSYYMKCNQFTIYGNLIPFADVGLNTGVGGNLGPMNIIFPNGTHFECYFPPSQIAGLIYGDRKFRCYNKGLIFQKKNLIYSQFSIQQQKKGVYESAVKLKGGQIIGGIFKVKPQFIEEIQKFRKKHKNLKKFDGLTKQNIVQKCHTISGEWFTNIFIDSIAINRDKTLYPVEYAKNVLPSDSNHRLDVLYHKIKDLTNSQKEKQILQVQQRKDRKLRQKYGFSSH